MEKSIGTLQHTGHTPKRHSARKERMEDTVGSSDICGVLRVQL